MRVWDVVWKTPVLGLATLPDALTLLTSLVWTFALLTLMASLWITTLSSRRLARAQYLGGRNGLPQQFAVRATPMFVVVVIPLAHVIPCFTLWPARLTTSIILCLIRRWHLVIAVLKLLKW